MTQLLAGSLVLTQKSQKSCTPARCCSSRRLSTARRSPIVCAKDTAADDEGPGELTGEWPASWSLASYEDVGEYFKTSLFKDSADPATTLESLMSTGITCAHPEQELATLGNLFEKVSGVPVTVSEADRTLVGVLSKKDLGKPGSKVKDIMSTPPIAARPTNKVADAAALMLKHKVHRIPIVDTQAKVVGMVTRTDIFTALEEQK